jgi:hypothetical protein
MPNFSEVTFDTWRKPPSDSEEQKLSNANRMVKEAIAADPKLQKMKIEVFGQGSYANDTNVRLNSDIDINVCLLDTFYYSLPDGMTKEDFGFSGSSYSFEEFKDLVEGALVSKFGRSEVVRNDKCITVKANSNRIEADVVPTFEFRRYKKGNGYDKGTKFRTDGGNYITNYPKQHIDNAIQKNKDTQRRFKRVTRLFRRLRYRMIDEGKLKQNGITSFLLECLVWNVPNHIFNDNESWADRLKQSILYLYEKTKTEEGCSEWGEVSELLYLFRGNRKWTREDVNKFLVDLWHYIGY